ncbi:MAG: hypothetical protein VW397_07070, partial [Candidatus Margulisiibacteriota bacterium]
SSYHRVSNANLTTSETILIPIYNINRSILANTALSTNGFYNEELVSVSEPSLNVSIATKNIKDRLFVSGSIRANGFRGDASKLENLDYIRWVKLYERIYYEKGNVGVGEQNPQAPLHIHGNFTVTQHTMVEVPPLLVIQDTLIATFNGKAQQISSFNASNFSTGTIHPDRIFGNYPFITGIGSIRYGTWNASEIHADYIAKNLSITNSNINNLSIEGNLTKIGPVELFSHSNTYPLQIYSKDWQLIKDAQVSKLITPYLTFGSKELITNQLDIYDRDTKLLSVNNLGNVGLFSAPIIAEFNPSGAIILGNTSVTNPGTLRLGQYFEAYSSQGWRRFDQLGNFTGTSLFAQDNLTNEVIKVISNGNIGLNDLTPEDDFVISGNVVFIGNSQSPNQSTAVQDGEFWAWFSKPGGLRIGKSDLVSKMNATNNIGLHSTAIGAYAAASGTSAVNISSPTTTTYSDASGENSISIGSFQVLTKDLDSIALAAQNFYNIGTGNILMSSKGLGSDILSENSIFLNGVNTGSKYNQSIIGGYNTSSAKGNNSFLWEGGLRSTGIGDTHQSFILGPTVQFGINTNDFSGETMHVNGKVLAPKFEGYGHLLTGDIQTKYLKVEINGKIENIYPTTNTWAMSIYVSDINGFLPDGSVSSASIKDGSIEAADIDGYSIGTHKLVNQTLTSDNFADGSITNSKLVFDDLGEIKFKDVTGEDILENSIDEFKLATDSIYTVHLMDQAVTTVHIGVNMVNSTNMAVNNIALHSIQANDIKVERLPSPYFATGAATGINIAHEALFTVTNSAGILESYFVWESPPGTPSPQIQEQHINTYAVRSNHIPASNIISRTISPSAIKTNDLTVNRMPGVIIADDRTLSNVVFTSRHFYDNSLTNNKFFDDPIENFQLASTQIKSKAISTEHLAIGAVQMDHIASKNIVARHIKSNSIFTSKFDDNAIFTRHLNKDSISSNHIQDHSLQVADFSLKSINGSHIVTRSVTSRELANNSISKDQLTKDIVDSNHIIDKTIGNNDLAPGAISSEKIKGGSVSSSKMAADSITKEKLASFNLTTDKFADNGIAWDDFVQPPDGYLPPDRIGDNSLDYEKKFIQTGEIDGAVFATASIGATQLNIPTFSIDKLSVPLDVSKGGTGLTQFKNNAIFYIFDDNGKSRMGQTDFFRWNKDTSSSIAKHRLLIAPTSITIPTAFSNGVLLSGNILVEDGALILKDHGASSYTFVKYNTTDQAIQLSHKLGLNSNSTNMNLKTKVLSVNSNLLIGAASALNGLDLNTGFRLGTTYVSSNKQPPTNGLIIQDSLQIGGNPINNPTAKLSIYEGKAQAISTHHGIIANMTGLTTIKTPLKTDGRQIGADAPIGIESQGPIPMQVTINSQADSDGLYVTMTETPANFPQVGVYSEMQGPDINATMNGQITYVDNRFSAGVYGTTPDTKKTKNYAAVFAGNLNTSHYTNKSLRPTQNLRIETFKVQGLVGHSHQTGIISSIDWTKGNIATLEIDDNNRTIVFSKPPEESCQLIILINHSGTGKLTFSDSNIVWAKDFTPSFTRIQNRTDIVHLSYRKINGQNKYFASGAWNFHIP